MEKVSVPFTGGIDTKSDEKTVGPGKLLRLENGVFSKGGTIKKRNGYTKLKAKTDAASPAAITTAKMLASRGDELVMADSSKIYSYTEAADAWIDKGTLESVIVSEETISKATGAAQTAADSSSANGVRVTAWEDSRGGVYYSVQNEGTGAYYQNDTQLDSQGSRPRVVKIGENIVITWMDTTDGEMMSLKISTSDIPNSVTQIPAAIAADIHASNPWYDVKETSGSAIFCYRTSTPSMKLGYLKQDGTVETSPSLVDLSDDPSIGVAVAQAPDGKIGVAYWDDTNGLQAIIRESDLSASVASAVLDSYVSDDAYNITCTFPGTTVSVTDTDSYDTERDNVEHLAWTSDPSLVITGDLTIEGWVKLETFTGVAHVIAALGSNSTEKAYKLDLLTTNKIQFQASDDGVSWSSASTNYTPTVGVWTHIAVTYDISENDVKFYVNGSQQGATGALSSALASIHSSSANGLVSAQWAVPVENMDGKLSEVRIWDDIRTAAEINNNYEKQLVGNESNLQAYWKLGDTSDSSSNSNTLTQTGAGTFGTADGPIKTVTSGTSADNYVFDIYYEFIETDGQPWTNWVNKASYTSLGNIAVAAATYKLHAGLGSHAFSRNSKSYVGIVHGSPLQGTFFMLDGDGYVAGKALYGTGDGLTKLCHLPSVQNPSGDSYDIAAIYKRRVATTPSVSADATQGGLIKDAQNAVYAEQGVKVLTFDWDSDSAYATTESGRCLYVNGGFVQMYDGMGAVESGFHLYPENILSTAADDTANNEGALTASKDYSYRVYYEWTNAQGERERSTMAGAHTETTGAHTDPSMILTIPTLSFTAKTSPRSEVSIVVYRTENTPTADAPFYRVSSPDPTTAGNDNGYLANDPTTAAVTFTDNYADTVITVNELDYQNTGELDNVGAPSASVIAGGKDRVFLAGLSNPNRIQYSKYKFPDDAVAWNDALTVDVDPDGGPITALAILNEVLVIFKERRIFALSGDGANNFGAGGFAAPQLITSDTGCSKPRSVVMTPAGLMFQSAKGIYLLDQGFRLSYVGASVEAYNSQTFTSAEVIPDANQVRFIASSGKSLVYDTLFQQWGTFTNHIGADAVVRDGVYYYLRNDGEVFKESSTAFADAGSPYKLLMQTPWIKFDGLQGFHRVRRLALMGEFSSDHTLKAEMEYDYEAGVQDTASFDASTVMNNSEYGDGATYGADNPYGGSGESVYQFRVRMPRQKMQSVRYTFSDIPGTTAGGGYEITELALEVGSKRGLYKLQGNKTVTTS